MITVEYTPNAIDVHLCEIPCGMTFLGTIAGETALYLKLCVNPFAEPKKHLIYALTTRGIEQADQAWNGDSTTICARGYEPVDINISIIRRQR